MGKIGEHNTTQIFNMIVSKSNQHLYRLQSTHFLSDPEGITNVTTTVINRPSFLIIFLYPNIFIIVYHLAPKFFLLFILRCYLSTLQYTLHCEL